MQQEDHVDKFGVGIFRIHRGVGAADADAVLREHGRNFRHDAGTIGDIEAHVIRRAGFLDRQQAPLLAPGQESTVGKLMCQRTRSLDQVCHHRGGRGIFPGTATVKERFPHPIAMHRHGIENAIHRCENVMLADKRGLQAQFDGIILVLTDHRKQFDHITELLGEIDVDGLDLFDANDMHLSGRNRKTIGKRG